MVLWRLCSSVTCSWVQLTHTHEHAGRPLISFPSWASSEGWFSSSFSSFDACSWMCSRSDGEWNTTDLIHCIYANNMPPHGYAMALILASQLELQASTSTCALQVQILSLSVGPRSTDIASGCQYHTAFRIFTHSNSLWRQRSPYICAICYTMERLCSDV